MFVRQLTRAAEPFLPLPILANPVVVAGTLASSCAVGVSIALTVYLPLYFQLVHELSVSASGLALIPLVVMFTPGSIMAGRALSQMRHYKRLPIAAVAVAIGAIAVVAWWPAAPLWLAITALTIVSFGCGSTYPISTVCVQNAVPVHQVGTVTGVMNFFRALASAFEVAVLGAVVLAGFGVTPQRGHGADLLIEAAGAAGTDPPTCSAGCSPSPGAFSWCRSWRWSRWRNAPCGGRAADCRPIEGACRRSGLGID